MGKVKSAIITWLLVAVIIVAAFFATVSFPVGAIETYNPIISAIHLGGDLSGYTYATLFPEGVISAQEYNFNLEGYEGTEANEYAAKYSKKGSVYVEKTKILDAEDENEFLANVQRDAEILSKRFGERKFSSYSVSIEDGYTIKVGVPSNANYASYSSDDNNDEWTAIRQEITQAITNLTMGGAFSLRNATTGTSIDGVEDLYTLIEKTQDITELFRGVKKYAAGGQYAVEILLTEKGREVIKEATSTVAGTEDQDVLFYVGEEQLLKLTCDGMIDSDSFFISVEDNKTAEDYSILLNSVTKGECLSLIYEYDEVSEASASAGSFTALMIAIAVAIVFVAIVVASIIRYKKLGVVVSLISALYILIMIYALCIIGTQLTLAGLAVALLGFALLLASNFVCFEEIRKQVGLGRTMQAAIKTGYKNTLTSILDVHVITVVVSVMLTLIGVGELSACGLILLVGSLASYALYWFTRFMWYVMSGPVKDKFGFGGYVREVYGDE